MCNPEIGPGRPLKYKCKEITEEAGLRDLPQPHDDVAGPCQPKGKRPFLPGMLSSVRDTELAGDLQVPSL